jgi:hypothetical protein
MKRNCSKDVPIPRFYPPVRRIAINRDDYDLARTQGHWRRQWFVFDANGSTLTKPVGPPGLIAIDAVSATHGWGVAARDVRATQPPDVPDVITVPAVTSQGVRPRPRSPRSTCRGIGGTASMDGDL